jgi:AcrR family transcriptional regulator
MSGNFPRKQLRLSPEQRAELILTAAAEVFAGKGYDNASMREIAQASGVTTPVLYDHFKSKIDLYTETVHRQAGELIQRWVGLSNPQNGEDVFDSATSAFFLAVSESQLTWKILFANRPSDEAAVEVHERAQAYAAEAVAATIRQLGPLDLPPGVDEERAVQAMAEAIKAAGHALIGWWHQNRDIPIDAVIALNKMIIWSGLANITKHD